MIFFFCYPIFEIGIQLDCEPRHVAFDVMEYLLARKNWHFLSIKARARKDIQISTNVVYKIPEIQTKHPVL